MTICLICDAGERAGQHDWKTGWTRVPCEGHPKGHKFEGDLRPDCKREHRGFHDRFVSNKRKQEQQIS